MKITSSCEREFIENCISKKGRRLDGRNLSDGRILEIAFGQERGCCKVMQGNTRVFAQVTSEITEPKTATPTEGALHVNLELSAMAAPEVKSQLRTSDEAVESQRVLERCVRDSKCIDLESLCIVAGSKVWTIRVDIHTLNDDGNLVECASIAAISALAHFRRPDVTVVGTEVTVHSLEEREPVALNLHHMPISVNLALYEHGKHIVVDPIEIEEKVADGCYIIGINAHQEICLVHRRGVLLLQEDVVQRCEEAAVRRAQTVTQVIRAALDDDAYKRLTNAPIGFVNMLETGTILGGKQPMPEISIDAISRHEEFVRPHLNEPEIITMTDDEIDTNVTETLNTRKFDLPIRGDAMDRTLRILKEPEVALFEGGHSKWGLEPADSETSSEEEDSSAPKQPTPPQLKEEIETSSEEEETAFVEENQVDVKTSVSRGWYSKDPFA